MPEVRGREELRGWPAHQTAGRGDTRYDQMCRAVDEASTLAALHRIRDEASAWLLASASRNPPAAREAGAVADRAARRIDAISRAVTRRPA